MSNLVPNLIFILFAVFIVGKIIYESYQIIRAIVNYFFKDYINRHLIFRNLNARSKAYLRDNFRYYQSLNAADKILFEKRVQKFMDMKEFIPRGEMKEVTLEMKTLISASAIQITFGLPGIYFLHFYRILVYPDDYYSTITRKYHRGEVNTRGFIVLSWKSLEQGYFDPSDGRNLGLHEMAHALKIEDSIQNEEYDFFDYDAFHGFIRRGRIEMHRINNGEESFFRKYAATNDYEFFAVAVENFFEKPKEFINYHPELFQLLCKLLKQNPIYLVE
ncbi:MAG TPA: zinc-dependent peptidase [Cyclobacteriaceae bacterium]|nr:zinc-dependent peptidase [Cyclobacteriaceae bacterium]